MEAELSYVTKKPQGSRVRCQEVVERKAENTHLKCDVPSCSERRHGLSRYCKTHHYKHCEQGHPHLSYPSREEWKRINADCDEMLEWVAKEYGRDRLDAWLSAGARGLTVLPSMAIAPRKCDPKLTRRTLGSIVYAWAVHKRKKVTPLSALKLMLAAELYVSRVDDESPRRIRDRYRNKIVGSWITDRARVSQKREAYQRVWVEYPSWANAEGYWEERDVSVQDNFEPRPAVQVMMGHMIAEKAKKEGLLNLVKEYLEHKHKESLKHGQD